MVTEKPNNILTEESQPTDVEIHSRAGDLLLVTCNECNYKNINKKDIEDHAQKEHNNKANFVCNECTKTFLEGEDYNGT